MKEQKNPNLNFDVTYMPQLRPAVGTALTAVTFGKIYGVGLIKTGKNITGAFTALSAMIGGPSMDIWSQTSGLPSVLRGETSPDLSNSADTVFYTSALWSRGWLDSDSQTTENIFQGMIENVTSGQMTVNQAIDNAGSQLDSI